VEQHPQLTRADLADKAQQGQNGSLLLHGSHARAASAKSDFKNTQNANEAGVREPNANCSTAVSSSQARPLTVSHSV